MASLTIYNKRGDKVGTYEIDPRALAPRISKQLLHEAVVMYQRNVRQGTAKSKARSEVAGTTKKMYRQKGTGNARAGSRRSGVRRGGGHLKHKTPRDWYMRLPRKALQAATRMALASKIRDDQVTVIDELSLKEPKTQEMAAILKALKLADRTVLVTTADYDPLVYKSARNITGVTVSAASDINAYSVLSPRKMLVTKAALDALRDKLTPAAAPPSKTTSAT
ncbi:MAG: 50S ribosomal protein L4 [Planctomycetia bacterium]|nr:50S ribosomal protein L4 [Planctomycetia bacterium]